MTRRHRDAPRAGSGRISAASLITLAAALAALLAAPPAAPGAAPPESVEGEQKRQEVERFVAEAEKLIRGFDFSGTSTPHYKIRTDDPRLDVGRAAALLEDFRSYFESFWAGRRALAPRDEPVLVYLFYSRARLNRLLPGGKPPEGIERVGHYQVFYDVIALHTDTVGLADLPDVLVHEAAHHLIERRLLDPERRTSLWLAEGLATYFGNTRRAGAGAWETGAIGGKGVSLERDEKGPGDAGLARRELRMLKAGLFKDNAPGPDQVVRLGDPALFYGTGAPDRYALSWILVHYLMHADGGAHAAGFLKYLEAEAAGSGGPEAFYRDTGLGPEPLDAAFRAYAKKLRAR